MVSTIDTVWNELKFFEDWNKYKENNMPEKKKTATKKPKSVWETLSRIDVNEHTEDKGGLTYLSWAWAWGICKDHYPDATFTKHTNEQDFPCFKDDNGFAFVKVTVTIQGESVTEFLPVLDFRNAPIENPNAFAVNTALQRCLAKCLAYFGLGHYIYAGEDMPRFDREDAIKRIEAHGKENDGWLDKVLDHYTTDKVSSLKDDEVSFVINTIKNKETA